MKSILESERLIQDYFTNENYNDLLQIVTDKQVMEFVLNGAISESDFDKFIKLHFATNPNYIGLGVLKLKETNEVIGFSGIHKLDLDSEEKAEIGFVINTPFQRKGYALEIGLCQLAYLKSLGYQEVFATVHPENINSKYLVENKLSMHQIPVKKLFEDRGDRILFKKTL